MNARRRAGWRRIIARTLLAIGVSAALAACTVARLAYPQAPHLAVWWIDGYADLDDAQGAALHTELDALWRWHRQQELPRWAALLREWQALAPGALSGEQVCRQFDGVRERLDALGERAVPSLARLATQLTAEQQQHLARRQSRSNRDFARDFLRGDEAARLERRTEQAVERYERLYGRLSAAQRALVREQLRASPFDPARTQAERERRQADLRDTVARAQADPAQAEALVRAHLARFTDSPTPGYNEHLQALLRHGCAMAAAVHNSASPAQRAHALGVLKGYEDDARQLAQGR